METTIVPASDLTNAHLAAWAAIQEAEPALASPYFRPEFTLAVASVRSDVFVALLEEGGHPRGFFPFQRNRYRVGWPVGYPLSDFQGVVAPQGVEFDAEDLIRTCGLVSWRFDHLPVNQAPFRASIRNEALSPYLDLSGGFEAYQEARREAGSQDIPKILRQSRSIERHVGALRFEFHTADEQVFGQVLRWKAEQYTRTGFENQCALPWVVGLLDTIRRRQDEAFAGVLSALWVGDRLAAVHFGMRSRDVLHYWFPAYGAELATYSPGRICLLEIAREAAAIGIRRLDLGKGDEPYKTRLMSGATALAEGAVLCHPSARLLDHVWQKLRGLQRSPALGAPLRLTARLSRPLRRWLGWT